MASKTEQPPIKTMLQAIDFVSELEEQKTSHRKEIMRILLGFLEVKDSLEHILAEHPMNQQEGQVFLKPIELLLRQMDRAFEQSDVQTIECIGQEVDPEIHQIVQVVECVDEMADQCVLAEKVKGYLYRNELLRRPQVVVGKCQRESL